MYPRTSRSHNRWQRLINLAMILSLAVSLLLWQLLLPGPLPDLGPRTAEAHNLDTDMVYVFYDPDTQQMLSNRILSGSVTPPNPLIQNGDVIGVIIKVVPNLGTETGVGGYADFYVPGGVQVVDAAFLEPAGSGGFKRVAAKGQALMPDVGAGGESTVDLTGIH